MQQPEGFEERGEEHLVCRLKKSLYGLKQAPRQWYQKFESFMTDQGYHKTQADHCMFVNKFEGGDFLILLYVNMLIVGRDQAKIRMLKKALNRTFAMKDLGPVRQILGMHIIRDWCHVLTRVRGEQGGTTGVLDRGIGEEGEERKWQTGSHSHRHGSPST